LMLGIGFAMLQEWLVAANVLWHRPKGETVSEKP
jgi:hypothetical protein